MPPREASRWLGIHYVTLKRWIYSGKIRAVRTPTGRWMIPERRIISGEAEVREIRALIYARVSSSDQRSDLERQIQYLTQYCSAKGYRVIDILSDVTSGLKTNRRSLLKLFNYVVNGRVDLVVITYRDRLTRFGFEYLEYFFKQYASIRIKSFLKLKRRGLTKSDKPEVNKIAIWLDDHLWKSLRYTAIKVSTHRG